MAAAVGPTLNSKYFETQLANPQLARGTHPQARVRAPPAGEAWGLEHNVAFADPGRGGVRVCARA